MLDNNLATCYYKKRREYRMAKVLVMRYNKGKIPPSALTDEIKQQVGGAMEKYLTAIFAPLCETQLFFID